MKLDIENNKNIRNDWMCDDERIYAFGNMVLEKDEKSQSVIMDIDVLIDALTALKTLNFEYITLRVQTDYPMLITDHTDNKMSGLIIAPRIRSE